ncbi:MAG: glycosyltransferase family 4 protein [Litoreibacter sp.]
MHDPVVIAPNLKMRLSGVTSTIARLVPLQAEKIGILATGPGLPSTTPHLSLAHVLLLSRQTRRVWHARRNTEMALGLVLKYVMRKNLKLLFTSASQREHSGYTKWLISQMDAVIATSANGAAYLKRPSKVVHHGIDPVQFRPGDKSELRKRLDLPEGRLIGCFGRIRHQKGTDVFVEAMLANVARHDDITGVILGRATEKHQAFEQELKDRISAAGLTERIRFYGEVPVNEISQWYQSLDLFVAPQRWEGFGLTPLEAMACGVPVLATRVGAFEELILDKQTGRLIDRDDIPAMTQALDDALNDRDQMLHWSKAARAHVCERFTLEKEADALIDIYKTLLA